MNLQMSDTPESSHKLHICTNSIPANNNEATITGHMNREESISQQNTTSIVDSVENTSALAVVSSVYDNKNAFTINNITNQTSDTEHCSSADHLVHHSNNQVLNATPVLNISPQVQVIPEGNITSVTDNNGAIYLLVSNDSGTILQNFDNSTGSVNVISAENLKTMNSSSTSVNNDPNNVNPTVQIINSNGVPLSINVNEILSTMTESKDNLSVNSQQTTHSTSTGNILNLSSSILSTTNTDPTHHQHLQKQNEVKPVFQGYVQMTTNDTSLTHLSMPTWAMHLKDCRLFGDTYTGYVADENDMDAVVNLYKKETQSLFAIRQTPSPAKDESNDTVRLMWKSQYVPYDGIPFVNVGRRATVYECEHGPRKRSNAIKRLVQMRGGGKATMRKLTNLTCPARLFVKKVRKFPQFSVPLDADPKAVRLMQEQSLKLVRQAGYESGEIRLYMQLPLPTAHRYHNVGSTMDLFQREIEDNTDDILTEPIAVDGRVLDKIRELVRQGFVNPFLVRATCKDFVENKMQMNVQETRPYKHNKAFYPPLIEIQNIIQQTQAAMNSGVLLPLPPPQVPPIIHRSKRKRSTTIATAAATNLETHQSPILIKRIKVDASQAVDVATDISTTTVVNPTTVQGTPAESLSALPCSTDSTETISLTLTDNQLENFSVQNFTYDQLAQLAKIGLLALNNAAKDPATEEDGEDDGTEESVENDAVPDPDTNSTTNLVNQHSVVKTGTTGHVDSLLLSTETTNTDHVTQKVMKVSELNNETTSGKNNTLIHEIFSHD